jgi:hypothetical protein
MKRWRVSRSVVGLTLLWAVVVGVHVILRRPDLWVWVGFPLLILPWRLFGRDWFER